MGYDIFVGLFIKLIFFLEYINTSNKNKPINTLIQNPKL